MKKLISAFIAMLLLIGLSIGQNLDGYKYIYIPTLSYTRGGSDIWSISAMLRSGFAEKGFIVLTESTTAPKDLKNDPCLLLHCEISHNWNAFSGVGKVILLIKNCKEEVVISTTGSSMTMTETYNKATKKVISFIDDIPYSFNSEKTIAKQIEKNLPALEMTGLTEDSIRSYLVSSKIDPLEGIYKSYQTDGMPYYKIGIVKSGDKFKAVIIESEFSYWKLGELKAVFEQSSMKGFYSIKWYRGDKTPFETFGSLDNPALLSIELKDQQTGEKKQDKFIKMFPAASDDVVFKKDNSKSSGSGFFVTPNGIIATNAHVIEDASNIEVTISNEVGTFTYNSKVLLKDSKNDVALLQIEDQKFKGLASIPYSIVENSDVGSKVFTIGYPLNDVMGTNYKVTDGIISSTSGIADDVRYYQISVPVQPGNSGGPLFNKDGNVIGITSARLNSKAVGIQVENVNYAIKSSYLLNLYNMLPNSTRISGTSQVASKELQDQIKILKNYVCLIKIF